MVKTKSLWGPVPTRYYRFLAQSEALQMTTEGPCRLTVLGCADGKFVLPAARKGWRVSAIDIDTVTIHGGDKPGLGGTVYMPGLLARLSKEGLGSSVVAVHGDFTKETLCDPAPAVWVSGAIQYSFNLPKTADGILDSIKRYVAPGGLLYIDYMLPWEQKYRGRANCPPASWWKQYWADQPGWQVLNHRVLAPTADYPHVEMAYPHLHQWGHLLARRREEP